MPAQPVTEHVYCVQNEDVKIFIIEQSDGLTVIDAGFPGTMALIDEAVRSLGRDPEDIRVTDEAALEMFKDNEALCRWVRLARERVAFQGFAHVAVVARDEISLHFEELGAIQSTTSAQTAPPTAA